MTVKRDPDAILAAWLEDGPNRLPDATRRAIAVTTRTTRQSRRPRWVPWRFPNMNGMSRFALAAVAVVAVALGGLYLLTGRPAAGSAGQRRRLRRPSSPSPSPTLSASPDTDVHVGSVRHLDRLSERLDHRPCSQAVDEWATRELKTARATRSRIRCSATICSWFLHRSRWPARPATNGRQPYQASVNGAAHARLRTPGRSPIDDAPGVIVDCAARPIHALTWVGDRGYFVLLYRSADEPWLDGVYDRTWFEQVLGTVKLQPEDAVAAPSPTASSNPSPSPS